MTDYKALREAAEKAKNGKRDERCSIVPVPPTTILSLLDALAASEAKVMKAREALKPFADDLCKRPWIASHLTWEVDKTNLTNRDLHRAATTLNDIA